MGFFSNKPSATEQRMLGELLAVRLTLATTLEAVGADFALTKDLATQRVVGLAMIKRSGYPKPLGAGFDDFMSSFISAARKHE